MSEREGSIYKMSKKEKNIIAGCVISLILVAIGSALVYRICFSKPPFQKMPCVVFAYRNDYSDVYIFDANGDIYEISGKSGKTNGLEWVEPTVDSLKEENIGPWLEKVGTVEIDLLQEQYNMFRKMTERDYGVYPTVNIIPTDEDSSSQYLSKSDYWYGFLSDTEIYAFYYKGYLQYDVTDKRAYQIVNWINDELVKCK